MSASGLRGLSHLWRPLWRHRAPPTPPATLACSSSPIGQPTPLTHGHLFGDADEVCPGIPRAEFGQRRSRLAQRILAGPAATKSLGRASPLTHARYQHHVMVIPAARRKYMIDRIPYFFRQDTDFRYLTGSLEPDGALIIAIGPESQASTLFVRDANAREAMWEGARTAVTEESRAHFGLDQILPLSHLSNFLSSYAKTHVEYLLWYDYLNPTHDELHKVVLDFMHGGGHQGIESPRSDIQALRVIKSEAEVALMRRSCDIAAQSIATTMSRSQRLKTEAEFFATVDYECRMRGAEYLAYPPVVASGDNANVIHYTQCTQQVQAGELILMDAGCELHGYTSDITRTWPVRGVFSEPQKVLYEMVLDVQQRVLQNLEQVGQATVDSLFKEMQGYLQVGLQSIGLIPSSDSPYHMMSKVQTFCPHHVSHYLGMDVHDTALVSKSINFKPNMVITVEPGLYIPQSMKSVPEEFRGIGIRIEDDVLITSSGYEVLSKSCPKTIDQIEMLIQSSTSSIQ
ncbi:xaa-Pro aminopeptidase 3-like [Tigriopus californicus]|uniref:xaa-Pro aminopeptidase 3-like n=1 Tax=Tigriopus californicus TaxID=6832 RepID=UPI0027D9F274|nr:xaa-Pro aminopeptidase 3-like [Tigriopus californicus]